MYGNFTLSIFNKVAFLVFYFILCSIQVKATHSMGADLTYQCMGGNTYKLTLSFYRDCFGIAAPQTVYIDYSSVSCGHSSFVTGYPIAGTGQEITPICPSDSSTCNGGVFTGIQEWVYEATVTLPMQCTDWTFSYSLCCRNGAITNIYTPLSEDIYIYSMLNNTIAPCNNSPTFTNEPVPFVCLGQQFCFNHGANDPDGDSLVYSLITPLSISGLPIGYIPPYSATQPLNSVPAMSFDSQSGDFCITPQSMEVTVMAVLVSEYRNGVLIGRVERDLQITVISCSNLLPSLSGINGTNDFTATVCQSEQLCFALFSDDLDTGQTVTMTWDDGIANGNFNSVGAPHPLGTFCWTPLLNDVNSSPHCFTVQVQDDACPYFGSQIYSYCITVIDLEVDLGPDQTVNCGSTITLTATPSGAFGNLSYLWSNGFTGASQQVGPGTYIVTVTDGMCSDEDTVIVSPLTGPTAQFAFTAGCISSAATFDDQSIISGTTTITGWNWDFGDGNSSSQQNPIHQYGTSGTFNVCLIVTTANGCTDTICQPVTIISSPVASFNAADNCVNSTVTFNNTSSAGLNYFWDFDNGITSVLTNPTAIFTSAGTYNILLVAGVGSACPDTVVIPVTIYPQPVAEFTSITGSTCLGGIVNFTDNSTGIISAWQWDFGNGQYSSLQNPSTTYPISGSYNVSLIVTNTNGCSDTIVQPVSIAPGIVVTMGPPATICTGEFASLSAGGGINYLWSDGSTTATISVNPVSTTIYTVTVSDANGCSGTGQVTITVNSLPIISLSADSIICNGESTLIAATGGTSYLWNTGQTTSTLSVSPATTTSYTVTVTDANNCSSSQSIMIDVSNSPVVNLLPVTFCSGDSVNVDAGNPGSLYLWNQGSTSQNIIVSQPGTYSVTVTNIAGCSSSGSFAATTTGITPSVTNAAFCAGNNVTLNAGYPGSSYLWSQGGSTNQSIVVSNGGQYTVIVTDANGCSGTLTFNVNESPLPVAAFNWTPSCSGLFTFSNSSTITSGTIVSFDWDFGNGSNSNIQSPNITFTNTGTYNVTLTVISDSGCSAMITNPVTFSNTASFVNNLTDTTVCENIAVFLDAGNPGNNYQWSTGDSSQSIAVSSAGTYTVVISDNSGCSSAYSATIQMNDVPDAVFSVQNVCRGDSCFFVNNSTIAGGMNLNYEWNFGDGNNSTMHSPTYLYNNYGNYDPELIVTSAQGCSDTLQLSVQVFDIPQIHFSTTDYCLSDTSMFNGTATINMGSIAAWAWNFGDGNTGSQQTHSHIYNQPGSYTVQLTVISLDGCTSSLLDSLIIFPRPIPLINSVINCIDLPVAFSINDTSGLTSYMWDFGDGTTSNLPSPQHQYTNYNSYQVTFTTQNIYGCEGTASTTISPYPMPEASFTAGNGCDGSTISFTNSSTVASGVLYYEWAFNDSTPNSVITNPYHMFPGTGIFNVELTATSNYGCTDSYSLPVTIYANPVAAFAPLETAGCGPLLIDFDDMSIAFSGVLTSWLWNFGDGNLSSSQNPIHEYSDAGNYGISLTVTNSNGCTGTISLPGVVTVHPNPEALFNAEPLEASILSPVFLTNQSTGATHYSWDFGDGSTSDVSDPTHIYNESGTYNITLLASTEFNCVDMFELSIIRNPDWTAYIPNVFSPNNDGINETFEIYGIGINSYEMNIWDRWGELIYNGNKGWDGSIANSSEKAKQDVYIYRIDFTNVFGQKKNLTGRVSLVR